MKIETLEEFARRVYDLGIYSTEESVKVGAKWQQERSHNDKEVLNILTHFAVEIQRQNKKEQHPIEIKGWFERNVKKIKL